MSKLKHTLLGICEITHSLVFLEPSKFLEYLPKPIKVLFTVILKKQMGSLIVE